jgi:hypothetical protein
VTAASAEGAAEARDPGSKPVIQEHRTTRLERCADRRSNEAESHCSMDLDTAFTKELDRLFNA